MAIRVTQEFLLSIYNLPVTQVRKYCKEAESEPEPECGFEVINQREKDRTCSRASNIVLVLRVIEKGHLPKSVSVVSITTVCPLARSQKLERNQKPEVISEKVTYLNQKIRVKSCIHGC